MIVRKSVINEIGALDPLFFIRCEDIDLSWRIRLRGYRIFLAPSSIVYHAGGSATSEIQSMDVLFHSVKNDVMMLLKNYSFRNLMKYNPFLIFSGSVFLDIIARKNIFYATTRLRAAFWVLIHFKPIWSNRQFVQKTVRKVPDSEVMKLMANGSYAQYFRQMSSIIMHQ